MKKDGEGDALAVPPAQVRQERYLSLKSSMNS